MRSGAPAPIRRVAAKGLGVFETELVVAVPGRGTESPVWDDVRRRIWFVDHLDGILYSYEVDSGAHQEWTIPGGISSLGLSADGRLVVAQRSRIAYFDVITDQLVDLGPTLPGDGVETFNDGKVGPDGAFWVGSLDHGRSGPDRPPYAGRLYRYDASGASATVGSGYGASNGLAWTADGTTMMHSDSFAGVLTRWRFAPASGDATEPTVVASVSAEEGKPDGAAFDVDEHYWSAGVSAGCINVFDLQGSIVEKIRTGTPAPTMVCFAGTDLYFTALLRDEESRGRSAVDVAAFAHNTAGLYRMAVGVYGVPVTLFGGPLRDPAAQPRSPRSPS